MMALALDLKSNHIILSTDDTETEGFENMQENVGNQQLFSLPTMLSTLTRKEIIVCAILISSSNFFNPFPNDKFKDSTKLKKFADDHFRFDENDRKFSKRVENTVGKGEIAPYKQLILFPQYFQNTCTADK